jgi:hypothetical protein
MEVPESESVVAFFENHGVMVHTSMDVLWPFLEAREPWEDIDICIFDQDIKWCLALTHNDEMKFVETHSLPDPGQLR